MISPQNLAIAVAATGLAGQEGDLFRKVVGWGLGLLILMCLLVGLQSSGVLNWMLPTGFTVQCARSPRGQVSRTPTSDPIHNGRSRICTEGGAVAEARAGRRSAAKDRAYDFVKQAVLHGGYTGGELISEGEVAEKLEMSRTPVREAFLRLETEGLLRLYPQRGALVVPVSPEEVRAVLEARLVVEQFAVEKVIEGTSTARGAVGKVLEAHLARQRARSERGRFDAFLEEDRLFHTDLVKAAGNDLFTGLYTSLRDRQVRMIAESGLREPDRISTILAEHAEIAAAVSAGDVDRARAAVRVHIAGTRSALGLS
jgi:DNA-binding GntR family transcriptional regulator